MVTWEQIQKANESIGTMEIIRKDKDTGMLIKKDYAEVNQRVKAFRMVYPTGRIETEIVSHDAGVVLYRATVGFYDENGGFVFLASGTAQEDQKASYINKTSYIENAETSAVGRALGFCGFGIETSICSAEEMNTALEAQKVETVDETPKKRATKANEPEPTAPKGVIPLNGEDWDDVAWRNRAIEMYTLEALDKSCMKTFGKPFEKVPVAQLKTRLKNI